MALAVGVCQQCYIDLTTNKIVSGNPDAASLVKEYLDEALEDDHEMDYTERQMFKSDEQRLRETVLDSISLDIHRLKSGEDIPHLKPSEKEKSFIVSKLFAIKKYFSTCPAQDIKTILHYYGFSEEPLVIFHAVMIFAAFRNPFDLQDQEAFLGLIITINKYWMNKKGSA